MVVRNVLLLICFSSLSLYAADNSIEHLKLMQLYLDKNQPEKVEDLYDEHEETLENKWMALERLAISFERREKFKEAVETYRKIINKFNRNQHERIISTPQRLVTREMYENNKLPLYYYKLAFLNVQLFLKTHNYTDPIEKSRFKKNAEGFIGLARKVAVDEVELKLLEEQLKEKLTTEENKTFKAHWYAMWDIVSWQDRVELINTLTKVKHNLLSTNLGTCLGAGRSWENVHYELTTEGCFVIASSTISSESTAVTYQQSKVPVKGLIAGPGMYFKSFSENILVGFHVPIMARKGDWTLPENQPYSFEKDSTIGVGYFLQTKFKVKNLSIRTRLGKIFPNPGSHWSIGAIYDF